MHPAPSIILFTVLSGIGLGQLFWLGLGVSAATGLAALKLYALGFALSVTGLAASTFHLGHPSRAWRAFTQWRTSWLSREAWLAGLALSVSGLSAALIIFHHHHSKMLGYFGAMLCLATVFATSMIYAQMKTVPRWNHWSTCALFIVLSLAGGAILCGQSLTAFALLIVSGIVQIYSWNQGDRAFLERGGTVESATQLGQIGKVRLFEPPHTGTNYILSEMVFQVGRKHAQKLRKIAFISMCVFPVVLLVFPGNVFTLAVALGLHLAGVLVSRWLFFAEAEHVVGLYYNRHTRKA